MCDGDFVYIGGGFREKLDMLCTNIRVLGVSNNVPNFFHNARVNSVHPQNMGDTQASFSPSVRSRLRQGYANRCAICLLDLPDGGAQCAHLFDSASRGADQVRINSHMTTLR